MIVFIVTREHWDDTTVESVHQTLEGAKACAAPDGTWVQCGEGVELDGQEYGHRVLIMPMTMFQASDAISKANI